MAHARIRARFLASVGLALGASAAAHAQAADAPAAALPTPGAAQASQVTPADEIVVTGSRIKRPEFEAPNPIVSLNAKAIQDSGNTNLTNYLLRVPALTNSQDATRAGGSVQADGAIGQAGLNLLDLRGLGTNRTLVLVDGRRHVASQLDTAAVDINAIPTDLVERVDVLTSGASAIYGADGVSGVVNFIMKRDFDGISARSQFGISQRGDAANRFASVIVGRNFAEGRGNITLAYEYSAEQPLTNDDRVSLQSANRVFFDTNKNYVAGQPGSYVVVPVKDNRYLGYYYDGDGVKQPGGSYQNILKVNGQFFRGDGQPYTFGTQNQTDDFSQGGDDSPVAGYVGDIISRTRRQAANLLSHFDFSDAFKVSVEAKFVQSDARTFGSYSGTYGVPITLDNPYIPASILAAAQAEGDSAVYINRNNFDLPRRGEDDRRRTYRGVLDLSGRISDHATYDAYYEYGRTDLRATKLNDRIPDRFTEALDAVRDPTTGQIECRSATARAAGCLPVNTFGAYVADQSSFGYFLTDPESFGTVQQHVANATLTGDFGQFFKLPGGPIQFAAGGEYRRESSSFDPNPGLVSGAYYSPADGIYDEPAVFVPSKAHFDVWELFGELNAPIIKDRPFAYLLSVGAAGRYSHYSTVGGTKTYQFNGIYAPVSDISFRGSYGRSVRAPNISELFRPQQGVSDYITDPCYVSNRNQGTQYRAANCTALITAAGGNPATFTAANNPDANVDIVGIQSGNPNLKSEVARTWTAGIVLRPHVVPRLQVSVDWYNIRIKDAINLPSATDIANLCVDLPTTSNPYCGIITRRQGTGYVTSYTVEPENVAAFRTAGLDVNIAYQVNTARLGRFDLQLVGGYVHKLTQLPLPGAVVVNNLDQAIRPGTTYGSPKYNVTFSPTWTLGPVSVAYNLRWQNGLRRFTRIQTDSAADYVDPRYFRFKALWQHDAQVNFLVNSAFSFYVGGTNLTDERQDIGYETDVPISPLGRYFYAGVKLNLARR